MNFLNRLITISLVFLLLFIAFFNFHFLYDMFFWTNQAAWFDIGPYSLPYHTSIVIILQACSMDLIVAVVLMLAIKKTAKHIFARRLSKTLDQRRGIRAS